MLLSKEMIMMLLLAVIIAGTTADLLYDYSEGASTGHLIIELTLVITSFSLISVLVAGFWQQRRSIKQLKVELARRDDRNHQNTPPAVLAARLSLAKVMQEQFETWQLTETERDVALLLLKGLSFKEIAAVRDTLEKTVRQQASSIYRKSGVTGRHAFAAWFIEDYL